MSDFFSVFFRVVGLGLVGWVVVATRLIAENSPVGTSTSTVQKELITPLEPWEPVYEGGWRMKNVGHRAAQVPAKVGLKALEFYGEAEPGAAKVSVTLSSRVPIEAQTLGFWVYREAKDNLRECGFEVADAEGELFMCPVEPGTSGWKWVEVKLAPEGFKPSFPAKDKNGVLDLPLRSAGVYWFSQSEGPSYLIVDGLVATTSGAEKAGRPLSIQMIKGGAGEPDEPLSAVFVLTNRTGNPVTTELEHLVQQDSQLRTIQSPDQVWGSDQAAGALSKTWEGLKEVETGSLTDDDNRNSAMVTWTGAEIFQTIDLGKLLVIKRVVILNSDANRAGTVQVSTSVDGQTYLPFKNGESIDLNKKWTPVEISGISDQPVRFLKFNYTGGKEGAILALPRKIEVNDGVADEAWAFPTVGKEMERGKKTVTIPPHSFECLSVKTEKMYPTGSYLLSVRCQGAEGGWLDSSPVLVLPKGKLKPGFQSRFGINVNSDLHIEPIQRLGMGWVRFENMKWPMMSKQPGVFAFDGSVGPVNADQIIKNLQAAGLEVLPFLFETAKHASPNPEAKNFLRLPPKDNADYAEYCAQVAARFGQTKTASQKLLTLDKAGGLGLLKVVEIWNEPNLQDPGWGHWIGTTAQYLELLRAGAEAVKKADPQMLVSPGGWAGVSLDYVAELSDYTYADGKHPSDFIDLINVHHYTGSVAPEVARINTNVDRGGNAAEGMLYEEELDELVDWRDRAMPGKEIWMTETGFDTGGPRAVSRREQAAYSVRNLMVIFASGIDKVFIYRITGDGQVLYGASGLILPGEGYKPSFFTVANLIRLIDGFSKAMRIPASHPETRLYLFEKNGEKILAAWGLRDGVPLGLDLGSCEVVDSFGARETRVVSADQVLGEFPLYFTRITNQKPLQELEDKALEERAQRKAKQLEASKQRTYLFDFGSRERVGGETIGVRRKYTSVVAEDLFKDRKDYGFDGNAKVTNGDQHWIKDLIRRDFCRVPAQGTFTFECEPGTYQVSLQVNSRGTDKPCGLRIEGKGISETLEFSRQEQTRELQLKLGGKVSLLFQDTGDIFWLKLVQVAPGT